MPVQFGLRGDKQMAANLLKLRDQMGFDLDKALSGEAEFILAQAKRLCPEDDNHYLVNSGKVEKYRRGSGYYVGISFGKAGPSRPYAVAVHEHPSIHSPVDWQGPRKVIRWTKPGSGPKFLERPLREAQGNMLQRVATLVRFRQVQATL